MIVFEHFKTFAPDKNAGLSIDFYGFFYAKMFLSSDDLSNKSAISWAVSIIFENMYNTASDWKVENPRHNF